MYKKCSNFTAVQEDIPNKRFIKMHLVLQKPTKTSEDKSCITPAPSVGLQAAWYFAHSSNKVICWVPKL